MNAGPRAPTLRLPAAVRDWLRSIGYEPLPFQQESWRAQLRGASGLIHAPTGAGKTLAAMLGPLLEAGAESAAKPPPLQVLWITPLRALSADTARQIEALLDGIGSCWSVGIRTGDTSSSERARQRRRLPSVLITTPESLSLLLSYGETQAQLAQARTVIVDEWHELLGSKRGVQLQLCLAWLRAIASVRIWGLSATMKDLPAAMRTLLGPDQPGTLIEANGTGQAAARIQRRHRITTLLPGELQRFPWSGHLGLQQIDGVIDAIEPARTALIFTNTRSQAERWFEALSSSRLDWLGRIALHHGSLDPAVRRKVEIMLRDGELKCVVATASLDLGVDFYPVDRVIQIGSAKGIARLLQRAGRSGHQPGGLSDLLCVPTHGLELIEFAAAQRAITRGEMEARQPPRGALDVLVQHTVTLALAGGVAPDTVFEQARSTDAYAALTPSQWQWVLDFVTRGGQALEHYDEYQRLAWDDDRLVPATARVTRRHRMAVGTISSDAHIRVQFQRGATLGSVEESFIAKLKPGDVFLFGGRALELCQVRDLVATVKRARRARTLVPRWNGGRMSLSTQLAAGFLEELARFERGVARGPELEAAAPMLDIQRRWSALPLPGQLLVEEIRHREGHMLYLYPFGGRQANDAIAALVAWRLSQRHPETLTFTANDYGIELFSQRPLTMTEPLLRELLSTQSLEPDLIAASNLAELAKTRFRDIARIAGLVQQGYPGAGKSARQVQASSNLLYDVLATHDKDNLLLAQATTEVLTETFDLPRVRSTLARLDSETLCLKTPARLTPFAMPLWVDRQGATLSSESWEARIQAMLGTLEAAATGEMDPSVIAVSERDKQTHASQKNTRS
ncbi:MAG: ligase-associated DNA damage response DEXH box helicase [Pseudomonadota bacterium]